MSNAHNSAAVRAGIQARHRPPAQPADGLPCLLDGTQLEELVLIRIVLYGVILELEVVVRVTPGVLTLTLPCEAAPHRAVPLLVAMEGISAAC